MNRIILNETSYFGAGCRSVIAVEAARPGFKKAFFVTDKDLIKFGVAAEIIRVFDDNHIPYELYSDVKANPTIANAILDRLVHHSEIFKISGKSYRMKDYTEQHTKQHLNR